MTDLTWSNVRNKEDECAEFAAVHRVFCLAKAPFFQVWSIEKRPKEMRG